MRAADREGSPARMLAGLALGLVWWAPTILLTGGGFALQVAGVRFRLWRVGRLMAARRLDEANRVLRRLRAEMDEL